MGLSTSSVTHLTYCNAAHPARGLEMIFPYIPGSRLRFFYRDGGAALLHLVIQRLMITSPGFHNFRFGNDHEKHISPDVA